MSAPVTVPDVTWWCWDVKISQYAIGSMPYCRFGRHGEHSQPCGFKQLVPADALVIEKDENGQWPEWFRDLSIDAAIYRTEARNKHA